jgi:hypothetical protein
MANGGDADQPDLKRFFEFQCVTASTDYGVFVSSDLDFEAQSCESYYGPGAKPGADYFVGMAADSEGPSLTLSCQ